MPASFLKIGGELVQDAILQLVDVTQELNCHWWCSVECRQTEDRRIPVEDLLGQDLQILTRDQTGAEHVVFDGFILEAGLLYEIFGSYTARLKAVTRSYRLELTAQEAYYQKQTLSGVVQALCGADGLTASILPGDGPKRNYVQWGEPDFQFLVRLADDHQAWVRPTAGGIEIRDSFQPGTKVRWRQEDGLLEFEVEGELAPLTFDGTHFDARQMRSVTHTAIGKSAEYYPSSAPFVAAVAKESKGQLPPGAVTVDDRAATADEYKVLLERECLRAAASRLLGRGVSQKEDLRAGDTIEIDGVLDGKGTYGVTKVLHRWGREGYRNEFWCTPAKVWLSPQRLAQSEIAGVVTARVVDQNDPRHMGRVQVQYDWQENGPTGWVRATTPHAGQDRGFLFLPEAGDEVVIAFEHGDPERPYVVGSLWNGVDTTPREEFWGEDVAPNDVKRIVTKSGHRIQLVDKPGKESIVIATPQHLKISLIEKTDETGRSMILLHSEGDIFIDAPGGRVHLRSATLSQEVGGGGSSAPASGGAPMNIAAASPATAGSSGASGPAGGSGAPPAKRAAAAGASSGGSGAAAMKGAASLPSSSPNARIDQLKKRAKAAGLTDAEVEKLGKTLVARRPPTEQARDIQLLNAALASDNPDRAVRTYLELAPKRAAHPDRITPDVQRALVLGVGRAATDKATGHEGVIGETQAKQAADALIKMSKADFKAINGGMQQAGKGKAANAKASADTERALMLKAVAARKDKFTAPSPIDKARNKLGKPSSAAREVTTFGDSIRNKDRDKVIDQTTVIGLRNPDTALQQRWSHSCGPTAAQMTRAESDPIYAQKLNKETLHSTETTGEIASEQKKILESNKGIAVERGKGGGVGMALDPALTELGSPTTHRDYSFKSVGSTPKSRTEAMDTMEEQLKQGVDVPIRVEWPGGDGHFQLASDVKGKTPDREFLITDPWEGRTLWVKEGDIAAGNADFAAGRGTLTHIYPGSPKP
jgi:type VI secretion system secreted protein VgrG